MKRVYNICAVFKGLEIIAKYILLYCIIIILLHMRPCCCSYYCMTRWISLCARALTPGVTTLLLRMMFVGKLPQRPVFEEREGKNKLRDYDQVVTFFPRVGTWTHAFKGAKPELIGSFATICLSLIELSIDSLQQPPILFYYNVMVGYNYY